MGLSSQSLDRRRPGPSTWTSRTWTPPRSTTIDSMPGTPPAASGPTARRSFSTNGPTGYYTGYRVQSGRARVQGSRFDVDILPVNDTGRAFALFSYGTGWQPEEENANAVMARGRLLDTDTIRIERTSPANSTWVSWEVIECLGQEFQVYRGSGSLGNEQSSVDAALSGSQAQTGGRGLSGPSSSEVRVDPSRCIAFVTADTSSAARTYYHEALLTAYVNSATTVHIERAAAGHSVVNYNWVVVEFDPATVAGVQHGNLHFTGPYCDGARLGQDSAGQSQFLHSPLSDPIDGKRPGLFGGRRTSGLQRHRPVLSVHRDHRDAIR